MNEKVKQSKKLTIKGEHSIKNVKSPNKLTASISTCTRLFEVQVKLDLVNFLGSGVKFTKSREFTKSSVTKFSKKRNRYSK